MASGRPVIAFGRGGAVETVIPGKTGVLFKNQTVDCLIDAIHDYEAQTMHFSPAVVREHALTFDTPRFKRELATFISSVTGSSLPLREGAQRADRPSESTTDLQAA